ncbi:hypothetical protein HOK68_02875 [Candidatus Woesearchaeota archaeon]|jgi:hypothetical protein|nr:hypothetical protein [Candidatus Woesearchaeota archaeon]MBT4387176.1 hypothetical protein [Candidatus Woesearchaeota archaeon]MBT4596067.1 hypothetical protein [Candidatus Woesearchaeota archaeon]MBT5741467.1 hypothetical protein [Candidatus Woesearchaeota archaeon]MBT6505696.1 hypothetical protein [Candidatus Woesearchaeota archaeon]
MSLLKDIESKNISKLTHKFFTRFGKGTFEKEICKITNSKKEIKFNTGYEYSAFLIEFISNNLNEDCEIDGKFISLDNNEDVFLKFNELEIIKSNKQFTKVEFKGKFSSERFKDFVQAIILNGIILINLKSQNINLKMKRAIPKPGKLMENFCSLKLNLTFSNKLKEEFFPEAPDVFKKGTCQHFYIIESIDIPDEYKNDFALAKIHAKRIGQIKRITNFDGIEKESKIKFNA